LKTFILILFFLTVSASWAQRNSLSESQTSSWTSVYQKVVAKVPVIVSGGGLCSGALIEQDVVVTAAHCVDRLHPIFVHFKGMNRINAKILVFSRGVDLALIKLESKPNLEPVPLLGEAEKNVEGTMIATIGHPVGQANFKIQSILKSEYTHVMSAGMISRVTDDGFVSDMSISPGNSGGPVLNSRGEIVGIVSKKRVDRFVGQLNYVSSHYSIHRLRNLLKDRGPADYTFFQASTDFDLYLLYSTPRYRRDAKGDAKSYLNVGAAIDFWDRLRFFADTNVDSEETFTVYGMGWNFYVQGPDPVQFYRIIPTIESMKFEWKVNGDEVEKRTMAIGLTLKASWFPFFVKFSQFTISQKTYNSFGLGLGF
jgi:serine protease Do